MSPPRQEFHIPRKIEGEFDVLELLKKTQAKISIYELIKALEKHRDILMEVLKKAQVLEDMPAETQRPLQQPYS